MSTTAQMTRGARDHPRPEFRALLRAYRDARGWSQEYLALEANIDHSLISRIEGGQRVPTAYSIGRFCEAFELGQQQADEFWLAGGLVPPGTPHVTLARLMAVVRSNGEGAVRVALQLVDEVRLMKGAGDEDTGLPGAA